MQANIQPVKIRTGSDYLFRWQAPEAILNDPAPTLVVKRGGVEVYNGSMTNVVNPQTIEAIGPDRKTLTVDGALLLGDAGFGEDMANGYAFYSSSRDGVSIPVKVSKIELGDPATVHLADKLPRNLEPDGILMWATWVVTFTDADVTEEASEQVSWEVEYSLQGPGEAFEEITTRSDFGRLYVVDRIFDTNLTTQLLHDFHDELGDAVSSRSNSREGVIRLSLYQMIQDIRKCMKHATAEDQLDGENFLIPHDFLTVSNIYRSDNIALADSYYEKYQAALKTALEYMWVDTDVDGEVDEEITRHRRVAAASTCQRAFPWAAYTLTCHNPYAPRTGYCGPLSAGCYGGW